MDLKAYQREALDDLRKRRRGEERASSLAADGDDKVAKQA